MSETIIIYETLVSQTVIIEYAGPQIIVDNSFGPPGPQGPIGPTGTVNSASVLAVLATVFNQPDGLPQLDAENTLSEQTAIPTGGSIAVSLAETAALAADALPANFYQNLPRTLPAGPGVLWLNGTAIVVS